MSEYHRGFRDAIERAAEFVRTAIPCAASRIEHEECVLRGLAAAIRQLSPGAGEPGVYANALPEDLARPERWVTPDLSGTEGVHVEQHAPKDRAPEERLAVAVHDFLYGKRVIGTSDFDPNEFALRKALAEWRNGRGATAAPPPHPSSPAPPPG